MKNFPKGRFQRLRNRKTIRKTVHLERPRRFMGASDGKKAKQLFRRRPLLLLLFA